MCRPNFEARYCPLLQSYKKSKGTDTPTGLLRSWTQEHVPHLARDAAPKILHVAAEPSRPSCPALSLFHHSGTSETALLDSGPVTVTLPLTAVTLYHGLGFSAPRLRNTKTRSHYKHGRRALTRHTPPFPTPFHLASGTDEPRGDSFCGRVDRRG